MQMVHQQGCGGNAADASDLEGGRGVLLIQGGEYEHLGTRAIGDCLVAITILFWINYIPGCASYQPFFRAHLVPCDYQKLRSP